MPSLPEAQSAFLAAVLGRDPAAAAPWPSRRLGVYRVNARENFAAALEAAFPLLLQLMGAAEFRSMAWAYQRACPSPSGNLFFASERLAGFLAERLAGSGESALAEVARFEWLVQEATVAADEEARPDLAALAGVPASRHGELRFAFHPAVRFFVSPVPIFDLWRGHQSGTTSAALPAAGAAPEHLLIRRSGEGVEVQRLPPAEFRCLEALAAGEPLGAAVERAMAQGDTPGDPGALLPHAVSCGIVTAVIMPAGVLRDESTLR